MKLQIMENVWLGFLSAVPAVCPLSAASVADGAADGGNRNDPDFVSASLVIVGSGTEMFTCAGHASIRMECPAHKLDYCFSYESEQVSSRIFTFFAGRLKMGMFAIPTKTFLEGYRAEGRGVCQYELNLAPATKRRLWKILDDKVAEGVDLPYDYLQRGCAWSTLQILMKALQPTQVEEGTWPEKFRGYQREVYMQALTGFPWTQFFIQGVVGTDPDHDMRNVCKVIAPIDLLAYLQRARFDGRMLIAPESEQVLVKPTGTLRQTVITPWRAAWLLLAVVALTLRVARTGRAPCRLAARGVIAGLLILQAVAGCFFTYLICLSSLPATTWNWLIVPFNPLMPAGAAWGWAGACAPHRWWRMAMMAAAAILLAWIAMMLLSPHQLTDPAYVVIAGTFALVYAFLGMKRG